jgi:hypothetical protein
MHVELGARVMPGVRLLVEWIVPCPLRIDASCVTCDLRGVSPARDIGIICCVRLIAIRRAETYVAARALGHGGY